VDVMCRRSGRKEEEVCVSLVFLLLAHPSSSHVAGTTSPCVLHNSQTCLDTVRIQSASDPSSARAREESSNPVSESL